jgi:hypothetical protein
LKAIGILSAEKMAHKKLDILMAYVAGTANVETYVFAYFQVR